MSYVYSRENVKQFSKRSNIVLTDLEKNYLLTLPLIQDDKDLVTKLSSTNSNITLNKNDVKFLAAVLKKEVSRASDSDKIIISSISNKLNKTAKIVGISVAVAAVLATIITLCVLNYKKSKQIKSIDKPSEPFKPSKSENKMAKKFEDIKQKYDALKDDNSKLEKDYRKVSSDYNDTSSKLASVTSEYDTLKSDSAKLKTEFDTLKSDYDKLSKDLNLNSTNLAAIKKNYEKIGLDSDLIKAFEDYNSLSDEAKKSLESLIPHGETFEGFAAAGLRLSNIGSAYELAKRNIFNKYNQFNEADTNKINNVFEHLLSAYNLGSKEPGFELIKPEKGSNYNSATQAINELKSSGKVKDVLLTGFKNVKDGNVHKSIISVDPLY